MAKIKHFLSMPMASIEVECNGNKLSLYKTQLKKGSKGFVPRIDTKLDVLVNWMGALADSYFVRRFNEDSAKVWKALVEEKAYTIETVLGEVEQVKLANEFGEYLLGVIKGQRETEKNASWYCSELKKLLKRKGETKDTEELEVIQEDINYLVPIYKAKLAEEQEELLGKLG